MIRIIRIYLLLMSFLFSFFFSAAQKKYDVSFNTSTIIITRSATTDTLITIGYTALLGEFKNKVGYKVVINPQTYLANLPPYVMPYYEKPFSKISENEDVLNVVLLKLIHDTAKIQKEIMLTLRVKNGDIYDSAANNKGQFPIIKIIVQSPAKITPSIAATNTTTTPVTTETIVGATTPLLSDMEVPQSIKDSCKISFYNIKPLQREKSDRIEPVYLDASALLGRYKNTDYTVEVVVDENTSDISKKAYALDFPKRTFKDLDTAANSIKNAGYLRLIKDSIANRPPSFLVLKTVVKKGTTVIAESKQSITINGIADDSLKSYHYLAYVGTNFDLVDGPRAKNLFFATNIFLPTNKKRAVGMYLSLYGNRTMTSTDTLKNYTNLTKSLQLSDSTYRLYLDKYDVTRTQVSDNLGAYVSGLFHLWRNASTKIQLYYAPSLEFVWRRTTMSNIFSTSTSTDSTEHRGRGPGTTTFASLKNSIYNFNEYVFNVGVLGFMVVHESSEISVRVHCSTGYSSSYRPNNSGFSASLNKPSLAEYTKYEDIFFCGRAWITEPSTGLTLQAEITNTWKSPRPFYGVTLSKAINFKNLGKIFQPIIPKSQ